MSLEAITKLEAWQQAIINFVPPVSTGKLPYNRFGVHYIADLYRPTDLEYMAALKPAVIKIINPSRDRVFEAFQRVDPNGHVALRYHPISEEQNRLQTDPVGLAHSHAAYWINQLDTTYASFDRTRLKVMGINEPSVHTAEQEQRVARYTEVFLEDLLPHDIGAWVFNFSVGWPREVDGRIIWDNFLRLESLINESNSYGCVHEYWYPHVMYEWNSYANRISRCPMKIKFIIGECGYTRQLAQLSQPWGWNGNISAETYADMLWQYHDNVDPAKVFAICPFTTSYGGIEWKSKDTGPAHQQILNRKRGYTWPQPWPMFGEEEPPVITYNLVWPKMERITQWYGPSHSGLDISMVEGTPLFALWNGTVAYSAVDTAANGGYGEYVRVHYPELGFDSLMGHLSRRLVQNGQQVVRGQLLGYSGNTGNSTGPHLHLEIRMKNDNSITDRAGVGPFFRGQTDPMTVKWALHNLYGHEDR